MTVSELIQALSMLDPNLPVFRHRPGTTMCCSIVEVETGTRWTDGTPAVLLLDTGRVTL